MCCLVARSPLAAQGFTVRAVPGIVLYELKSCQNVHLSTLPSCLFVLALMARVPWVCSFGISVSLHTEWRQDKIKPYVCRLPDSRWKEENAMSICFWDQSVIFPAVTVSQKNIFPTEQTYFHSVPIEMICWFWSTPGLESGREPLGWLPWFQAVPSLRTLNSKPLSWTSFLPLTYTPDQGSSAHCPLSLHTWSIFFPITIIECQCCNLFVIRTTIKIHLFFISPSMSSIEE